MLLGLSCSDQVAVLIKYNKDGAERLLVVCSAYLPYDCQDPPPSKEYDELVRYRDSENPYLVIACYPNAQHIVWGTTNFNPRKETLVEFLNSSNLEILNQGNEPAFCSGCRLEVIYITLVSFGLLESITSWEVSSEPSLSDHRYILFTLQGPVTARLIRNPRGNNWASFREGLKDRLERDPQMNMKDEAGLGFASHWVQQALISAYEDNCYLTPVKTGRQSTTWATELESLRRVIRLFNKCRTDNNQQAQRRYRKEVRKATEDAWRTFCSSINELPSSDRLHRALSRDPKIKLGTLVAPAGRRTQSKGETLEIFLTTHFPNLEVAHDLATPAPALRAGRSDWRLAARVIIYRRVEWAIDSFAPYESPGMDDIFAALLQERREDAIPYLARTFRACLSSSYVPAIWRQVKVVFIMPKPIRNFYSGRRDFRSLSLTSFLLKTMERMVDRYLRDEALSQVPLYPNQHAYQTGIRWKRHCIGS